MAVNIPGLVSVIVFYVLILATGIWAARKSKQEEKKCSGDRSEVAMIGGRNIGTVVGILTTTATWVGGGFINGIAEIVYLPNRGVGWAQAPISYFLNLIFGGLFFAKPMRNNQYVTMMDPFQIKFGNLMTSLLIIPAVLGDIFWSAAILAALGATMAVILDIETYLSIILSSCVVITYTLLGGLYSVAYTDVMQMIFIIISLWLCVPFTIINPAVADIKYTMVNYLYQDPWIGKVEVNQICRWIDDLLYMTLGGIPWQVYFQRVLAASSASQAQKASYIAGVLCFTLSFPSIIIGAVAVSTDWNQTDYGLPTPNERQESSMILPIVLQYLCPVYISILGIGAIAAAVMSSADSSLLSASSMFARNIYKTIIRKTAAEKEVIWVMRTTVILCGAAATTLALVTNSIYGLWFLSSELVYAILFPQFVCVLFIPSTNTYGSAAGYLVGLTLRLLAGEPFLWIPPLIQYPGISFENGTYRQLFPFKTFTMLLSLLSIVVFSYLASFVFRRKLLPVRFDVFKITDKTQEFPATPEEQITLNDCNNHKLEPDKNHM
ncbi:high affinity choline transporter 1-like isoform X2 [Scyliorhinus canicula]|uniref:high affinity choline transporter 1-like isoform X2 n=1 Tax=Scyliorhinus canicula TaxID=7830 RepID=UPI0018F62BCC|nr:high affinity choline transporter 1-like isoform X2 [Scyliorhinus canicula]